jgi:type VI secretion system protein ImpG
MAEHPHYREQLAFLLEGGRAMARAFPRAADRLAQRGLDPDVERLLEGVAFVAGKIDEKQDRIFPEICQTLFDILFPHYLCPVPATAIAQLEAARPCSIPRGTELESVPVLGTSCRFRTVYDVELGAVSLEEVSWRAASRAAELELRFVLPGPAPERVRLHLHGEPLLTRSLYHWLQARVDEAELVDGEGRSLGAAEALRLRPLGYAEEEALLPYPAGSFGGFRLLQEYFTLPQKFLFLDLEGLPGLLAQLRQARARADAGPTRFSLRFRLRVDASQSFVVTRQNFRLGCTPLVNLFLHSADPARRAPGRGDCLVRPAGPHRHYQIYRVLEVSGRGPRGAARYPLLSELDLEEESGAFCQLVRREHQGEVMTYLWLHEGSAPAQGEETILVDLLCTNGELPTGLRVGDSCAVTGLPAARAQLITPLTPTATVPVGPDLRWRLVTHLALSQRELTSLEALREAVLLYNVHALRDAQVARALGLLSAGMLEAETRLAQHALERLPIWGQSTTLTVDEAAFDTEGEMYLLGCVLNELCALAAPVNTFSEFALRRSKTKETFRWPKRLGRQTLA